YLLRGEDDNTAHTARPTLQAVDNANPANHFIDFTPANFNVPQTVRVTATNDGRRLGSPHTGVIVLSHTAAGRDATREVRIVDAGNDGLTVVGTASLLVGEGREDDFFWVVLNRAPTANVTVNLNTNAQINAVDAAAPANHFLTFTAANWSTPQRANIIAVTGDAAEQNTWMPIVRFGANTTEPHAD